MLRLAPQVAASLATGAPARSRPDSGPDPAPDWRAAFGDVVSVPIMLDGRPWGLCSVASAVGTTLAGDTERRLQRFAELAATAIANAESQRALHERAAEQAALRRVATAIAADAEPEEVFDLVCRAAAELLGVASAGIMRILDRRTSQIVASWTAEGSIAPAHGEIDELDGDPARGAELRAGRPVRFAPDASTPEWLRSYRELAAAPIALDGEVWGVLAVASADQAITAAMESRLSSFADLVGVAIASAEARRRSVDDAAAMIAGGGLDMDATLQAIVASARRALGADRATCFVLSESGSGFEAVHTTENARGMREAIGAEAATPTGRGLLESILAAPGPVIEREDVSLVPEEAELGAQFGVGAYLTIRLEHPSVASDPSGPMLGVLFISFAAPRRFAARDRVAARSLGEHRRARPRQRPPARAHARAPGPGRAARRDRPAHRAREPPGLPRAAARGGRCAPAARAGRWPWRCSTWTTSRRSTRSTATRRATGIIAEVAARLAGGRAAEALLARIGGEEFAWLLPGAGALEAWSAADRVREAVAPRPADPRRAADARRPASRAGAGARRGRPAAAGRGRALLGQGPRARRRPSSTPPRSWRSSRPRSASQRLERSQALNAIRVLARAVDTKDPSTREHSERVAELADLIARELGWIGERRGAAPRGRPGSRRRQDRHPRPDPLQARAPRPRTSASG